jgi:hypothetical protein
MNEDAKKPWTPPVEDPLRGVKGPRGIHPDNPIYCSCLRPPAKPDEYCQVHSVRKPCPRPHHLLLNQERCQTCGYIRGSDSEST